MFYISIVRKYSLCLPSFFFPFLAKSMSQGEQKEILISRRRQKSAYDGEGEEEERCYFWEGERQSHQKRTSECSHQRLLFVKKLNYAWSATLMKKKNYPATRVNWRNAPSFFHPLLPKKLLKTVFLGEKEKRLQHHFFSLHSLLPDLVHVTNLDHPQTHKQKSFEESEVHFSIRPPPPEVSVRLRLGQVNC